MSGSLRIKEERPRRADSFGAPGRGDVGPFDDHAEVRVLVRVPRHFFISPINHFSKREAFSPSLAASLADELSIGQPQSHERSLTRLPQGMTGCYGG